MRILAIRGCNLASLAGPFEVRLDAPPLDSAGLFAITGRTGAGKSTILDALCLALYDRMPRLLGGSGVEVGRADEDSTLRLKANDVRTILRRGAGEGYAEVDFRGSDRRCYRARWSVRRARGRADGRCQFQEMGLIDLGSGTDLGSTKTEVLARIESLLGLNFDQFRRSVLLPQGDFAAFLRADAKERADLLERITGTEIYGRLSRAAHERAKAETEQLRLTEERLESQRPLDDQARQTLEVELAEALTRLEQCRLHQVRLGQARAWYQTRERLAGEKAQARSALDQAEQDQAAAGQRRLEWDRVRGLQPLRLPLARRDQAQLEESYTRQALGTARAEAELLGQSVQQAEQTLTAATQGLTIAERARQAAAPALAEARRLDTLIQDAQGPLVKARQGLALAETGVQGAAGSLKTLEDQAQACDRALAEAQGWLAGHAGLAPVAAQWEGWERELARYAEARSERDQARTGQDQARAEATRLGAALEAESNQAKGLATRREEEDAQIRELTAQAAALDPVRLAAERESLFSRRQDLEQRQRLVQDATKSRDYLEVRRSTLAEVQARHQSSAARAQAMGAEVVPLRAVLVEAESAHQRLLLASAERVETLRQGLVEGEPCPVCGAEQHPWADRDSGLLQGLAREQSDRVEALRARVDTLTREQAAATTESEQAERRATELAGEIAAGQTEMERLLGFWAVLPSDGLRPDSPLEEGLAGRIGQSLADLGVHLERVQGDEARHRTLVARIEQSRAALESLRAQGEACAGRLRGIEQGLHDSSQAQARAAEAEERANRTLEEVRGLLAVPFAGIADWRDQLESDPRLLAERCHAEVQDWRRWETAGAEQQQARQDLEPKLAQARTRLDSARADLERCIAILREQEEALARLVAQRTSCLDGRPADEVEQSLDTLIAEARKTLDGTRETLDQTRRQLTALEGQIAVQTQTLADQVSDLAQATAGLEASLTEHGLTLDGLRQALEHDAAWVEAERAALQALDDARKVAVGLLEERTRHLEEQGATGVPEWPAESIDGALASAVSDLEEAQGRWGGLHGRREEDERRRLSSAALQSELVRQRARRDTWESLRGLIGSSDGSKFRTFAQGLTLELLVAHANVQLAELARRYQLQRVPGAEMDLQVIDREMGDEVRGVQSLSGGEGFLVSLALALGLASLASNRVQVESLFIDEGFGALDADSLDLAIASLDALYGLGRQVGVISHVGTLVERIGVKVQIEKQGGGRSRLSLVSG